MNRQEPERFRPNVAALIRIGDKYLRCLRAQPQGVWQTVQGGIEADDESVRHALLREMNEELGVDPALVRILGQSKYWRRYLFPPEVRQAHPDRLNIGQEQLWFLAELPSLECIDLKKSAGEFERAELTDLTTLVQQFVGWKLPVVKDFCYEMGLMHPFQDRTTGEV
jgi:putative (di)nucleoside polyphosphate hydrolase